MKWSMPLPVASIGIRLTADQLVPVAVHSSDPLSRAGVLDILEAEPRVWVLPGSDAVITAEIIVLVEHAVGDTAFSWLRSVRQSSRRDRAPRCVLITDQFRPSSMLVAVSCGVMAVLPRQELHPGQVGAAVVSVSQGGAHFSSALQGELFEQLDQMRRDVLEPNGLTMSGLGTRERDVLKGLADGLLTDEIAQEIGCSERTVKTVLYGLMARYNLTTRSQAAAYAVRAGVA